MLSTYSEKALKLTYYLYVYVNDVIICVIPSLVDIYIIN
jgi:hypothetical protein